MKKWPLYIGIVFVVLNCIAWISDPSVLPYSIEYGGVWGGIGASVFFVIGAFFLVLYFAINRKK